MSITYVCGIPCVGKTEYIKSNLPNIVKLDILDFQKQQKNQNVESLLIAQQSALNKLLEIAKDKDVVMEHTLLKKERRIEQITFLRENGYTNDINIVFLNPAEDVHIERIMKRNNSSKENAKNFIDCHKEILTLPNIEEGFDNVQILKEW